MIVEASAVGVVRTFLILLGVFFVLRFFGRLANAKRNMEDERAMNAQKRNIEKEKERVKRNLGKTNVIKNQTSNDIEDVDFEEVN